MVTSIKGNDTSTFGGEIKTNNDSIISNRPIVAVKLSADQSISDATWTKLQLDTEITDSDSAYDATTNYRFTVPSGKSGLYKVDAQAGYDVFSNSNLARNILQIKKNGDFYYPRADQNFTSNYVRYGFLSLNMIMNLNEGDYIEVFVFCDDTSGTPKIESQACFLSIHKLIG